MARRDVTIGDTVYHLTTLPPRDQLRIFGDLQKDLLPAAGDLIGSSGDQEGMAAALARLSTQLDGARLTAWVDRLLTPETVSYEKDGRTPRQYDPRQFDLAFEDFSQALELLWQVIDLNFAGPLGRWLGHFGPGLSRIKSLASGDSPTS